ncbi:hypothetical protein DYB32_005427 [Aphanomyces invadans]|uniref:Uncharacterized protein n=1 Tax=Aphanomyces invadans TaxID=157072 RepID=A0A3R6VWJ4_9STRA|nr:hypothetical protein DYB32_005427 [Aphanomyces invadans]
MTCLFLEHTMVDPTSGSPPRPFRSKVIEELTRRHDLSNDLTPSVCFQVLQSLLPSSLVVTMCAEMNRFIYKSPHDDDNNYTSNTASNPKTLSEGAQVPYKDLYLGLLAHVEDKEQLCAGLRRQLREKRHQNNTLAGEIAKYQGLVDEHFAAFNEQACLNAIETLKHRRVLRERQCTGLMKAIDEKQDRLIEQEKRIKEELHRLRMDDCAYRLNAKKFKENQQMLASVRSCPYSLLELLRKS